MLADDIYREGEGSGENILKVTAWLAGAAAQGTIIAFSVKSCIEIMQWKQSFRAQKLFKIVFKEKNGAKKVKNDSYIAQKFKRNGSKRPFSN